MSCDGSRARAIRLVQIAHDGSLAEPGLDLPEVAREALAATASLYARRGFEPPWVGYVAVEGATCIGTCAFTSRPCDERVEIAYFTFPPHEGRGIATAMARALVDIARTAAPDVLVTAHTLPDANASTRVLDKLGFTRAGTVVHHEDGTIWEWHLLR